MNFPLTFSVTSAALFAVAGIIPHSIAADAPRALFNGKDLAGWEGKPNGWKVEDGIIAWQKDAGYLWTDRNYGDFELTIEFKVAPGTNSGVFIRTGEIKDPVQTGIELQIIDSSAKKAAGQPGDKHDSGAIYDVVPARILADKPVGEWNQMTITAKGSQLKVTLNGEPIAAMDLDKWTEPGKNPDGSKNKFKTAFKDMPRSGRIGLQDHGKPVWFRHITIKEL